MRQYTSVSIYENTTKVEIAVHLAGRVFINTFLNLEVCFGSLF